jgi:hypothetical protein
MIGVWYQPLSSISTWKARGVNTLVGCPEGDGAPSKADWAQAARDAGMYYIFKPASAPDAMLAESQDPNLLGWMLPDEPDGAGNLSPDQVIALYKSFKQVANVPVFLNLDGAVMQYRAAGEYKKYCQGGDILAFDYYVANRGDAPLAIPTIGKRVDQLKSWGKGKPVVAFIECSDQQLWMQSWVTPELAAKMRGPTPQEMTKEINLAVSHGAKGIVYFPDVIGAGWISFDGVTPDLEAAMIDVNAAIIAKATGQPILPPTKGSPPKGGRGDRTNGSQNGGTVAADPTPAVPNAPVPPPDGSHEFRRQDPAR